MIYNLYTLTPLRYMYYRMRKLDLIDICQESRKAKTHIVVSDVHLSRKLCYRWYSMNVKDHRLDNQTIRILRTVNTSTRHRNASVVCHWDSGDTETAFHNKKIKWPFCVMMTHVACTDAQKQDRCIDVLGATPRRPNYCMQAQVRDKDGRARASLRLLR